MAGMRLVSRWLPSIRRIFLSLGRFSGSEGEGRQNPKPRQKSAGIAPAGERGYARFRRNRTNRQPQPKGGRCETSLGNEGKASVVGRVCDLVGD